MVEAAPDQRGRGSRHTLPMEDTGVTRATMSFAAFFAFLPSAMASLTPPSNAPALARASLPTTAKDGAFSLDKSAPAPAPEEKEEKPKLVITDKTEVELDGHACKFADVPSTASIVELSVGADKKTILKIHFQSQK
jgi:hypothetical protein